MNSEIVGKKFKIHKNTRGYKYGVVCRCQCGNSFITDFHHYKNSRSCGCTNKSMKHGLYGTPTYKVWVGMKQRCNYKKAGSYDRYGRLGIQVCDRWNVFSNFLEDMGEKPDGLTIDRIDGTKGYYKENCKWSTIIEQANNRKNNILLTIDKVTKSVGSWTKEKGALSRGCIMRRLKSGKVMDSYDLIFGKREFKTTSKLLTIDGITKNIREWSKIEGAAKYSTISMRLQKGWPPKEAVFNKLFSRRPENAI